jgi:signal transduction histidine kinase
MTEIRELNTSTAPETEANASGAGRLRCAEDPAGAQVGSAAIASHDQDADRLRCRLRQLIKCHEQERRAIAQELHGELGQILAVTKTLLFQALDVVAPAPELLNEAVASVGIALQIVRNLATKLYPAVLDDFGLEAAVKSWVALQAEPAGLQAHLNLALSDARFPSEIETACFRLIQAALTNTIRHANARQVWIDVHRSGQELHASVRNDGVPLDPKGPRRIGAWDACSDGSDFEERIELLGGRVELAGQQERGNRVQVILPLPCG